MSRSEDVWKVSNTFPGLASRGLAIDSNQLDFLDIRSTATADRICSAIDFPFLS